MEAAKFRSIDDIKNWLYEKAYMVHVPIRKVEMEDSWAPICICLDDILNILCGGDARLVLGIDDLLALINADKLQFYQPRCSSTPLVMGTPYHCIAIAIKYVKTGRFIHQFKLMFDSEFMAAIEREWLQFAF